MQKNPTNFKDPNIGKKTNKLQRPKDPNKFQIPNQDAREVRVCEEEM
jgi:hypothetical protein